MYSAQQMSLNRRCGYIATMLTLTLAAGLPVAAPAAAATLDKVRGAGKLVLGYEEAARPFSFKDGSDPAGYSVELCKNVAEQVKSELGLPELAVEWVPVVAEDRATAVAEGAVDLLCSGDIETLERRKQVSFSIPIYAAGVAAMLRADAPRSLQDVLSGRPPSGPLWRASPAQVLTGQTFAVVGGGAAETWLKERLTDFKLTATVLPVENYEAGVNSLLDGTANVFFGGRPLLMEAASASGSGSNLTILERSFTSEPVALAVPRNDDDFRLAVDSALSRYIGSEEFRELYGKWFGTPDEATITFFRQSALPE